MRDAQSALDQVIAFAGQTIAVEDVSTVLGLVGRDLLFDLVDAVIDEDAPRAFALADRVVESGHDLRLVCRELTAVVRDVMVASVDASRLADSEITEGERARLMQLAGRFSREDLMRAFDVLAKVEQDIRVASQPRYHFEMALLRWMHLRKLVPLTDLLDQLGGAPAAPRPAGGPARPAATARPSAASSGSAASRSSLASPPRAASSPAVRPSPAAAGVASPVRPAPVAGGDAPGAGLSGTALKDALMADVKANKNTLYSLAIAMAKRIDVTDDRVSFTFAVHQNVARGQLEQNREWLEHAVQRLAGKRLPVLVLQDAAAVEQSVAADATVSRSAAAKDPEARDPRSEAMASPAVRDLLDVFPAEIRDIEEL